MTSRVISYATPRIQPRRPVRRDLTTIDNLRAGGLTYPQARDACVLLRQNKPAYVAGWNLYPVERGNKFRGEPAYEQPAPKPGHLPAADLCVRLIKETTIRLHAGRN